MLSMIVLFTITVTGCSDTKTFSDGKYSTRYKLVGYTPPPGVYPVYKMTFMVNGVTKGDLLYVDSTKSIKW